MIVSQELGRVQRSAAMQSQVVNVDSRSHQRLARSVVTLLS